MLLFASPLFLSSSTESSLATLGSLVDNEYLRNLEPDPDADAHEPNKSPRQVQSGHFVLVKPTALTAPSLIIASAETCRLLQLSDEACHSESFVALFSGRSIADEVPGFSMSWATPYALSIYGQEIVPNGAGPQGYGYGDGRAISIGEVALSASHRGGGNGGGESPPLGTERWELQLKGAGRTPFCRNADGRAVLRSSTREFLASEAMAALGVPTTRALSLIVSGSETAVRPWYRNQSAAIAIGAHRPDRESGGDVTRRERAAITTRVATSFLRVGQFELYGRRARRGEAVGLRQLEQLARHAIRREYPSVAAPGAASESRAGSSATGSAASTSAATSSLQAQVLAMAVLARTRFAHLAAEWVRVGYTQSNFNADNCLIGGATVDYGPFGFIERYQADWAMWIGGGQHFSFMNQPKAAGANFRMFLRSLEPLLDASGVAELREIARGYTAVSDAALGFMWARKLGFAELAPRSAAAETMAEKAAAEKAAAEKAAAEKAAAEKAAAEKAAAEKAAAEKAAEIWREAEALLGVHPTDWTIFWRRLADVPAAAGEPDEMLMRLLAPAFYSEPDAPMRERWVLWLRSWLRELEKLGGAPLDGVAIGDRMRLASPKYVPREWMLASAYEAAERGDYTLLHELHTLFRRPYDEQPERAAERFFQRAPHGADQQGGVGFMS